MKKVLGLAAVFLMLAGGFAWLRGRELGREIPGAAVRFSPAHSLTWDPATRLIARTGEDPYGFLELGNQIPLREVTIEFGGTPPIGRSNFYVYQYPAYLDGVFLNDSYAVLGRIEPTPGGFRIRWALADSKVARLDLPDDLDHAVEIRSVTLVSSRFGSWAGTALWLCLVAAVVGPLWAFLRGPFHRHATVEAAVFTALIAAKLVVASDLRLMPIGSAVHDDALFVSQADSLMHGKWLGVFNGRTLSKGPVYSLFLAGVGFSGAPLQRVQAGLHALACAALVLALRPRLPAAGARLVLFIVLLFDPHTVSAEAVGRVLRSGIQPALALFSLAGVIGLALRAAGPPRRLAGWSLLAGLAIPAFWFSREEGIWLVPALGLMGIVAVTAAVRHHDAARGLRLALVALPCAMFFGSGWILRAVNAHYYGAWMTVDVKDGAFPAAYGALVRITPETFLPSVPVSHETQLRAYAASPAFAELRPHLEGPTGKFWGTLGTEAVGGGVPGEIRGGWYQWALRDAAAGAGRYRDAAVANAYWKRVADEINAACDQGRLAAGNRRTGFMPRWDRSLLPPLRRSLGEAAAVAIRFSDFTTEVITAENTKEQLAAFGRITHESRAIGWAPATPLTRFRTHLGNIYRWSSIPAAIIAGGSLLVVLLAAARSALGIGNSKSGIRNSLLPPAAILLAMAGSAAALMVIVALVDVTSFSAVHAIYLAPATPLVLAICVLAPVWAFEVWVSPAARKA